MFTKLLLENFLGTFMKKTPKYICIDEQETKTKVSTKKLHKHTKVKGYFQGWALGLKQQPLVQEGRKKTDSSSSSSSQNNTVRVKVLMTREEAAKLLAKCKREGTLEFKDAVNELAKIPLQRVSIVSLMGVMATSREIALASIIEEEELIKGC